MRQRPRRGGRDAVGESHDVTEVYELPDDDQEVSMLGTSDPNGLPDHPLAITVPPLPES